ncbi:MAG: ATP-binding protein, partial [Phycisphaerae bacterium]|nr:ATP-binding protein [Phycisphaerae bacterium]
CRYAARSDRRKVHIELDRRGRYGLIRVRDHGPGIAAAEIRRLFRPFHKSANEAARSAPGVGLGLALSRQLARDMNGDLRLDEQVKDGACFELLLPAESDL